MKKILKSLVLALAALTLVLLCACSAGEKVTVKIVDAGVESEVEVKLPKTVEEVLGECEIELGEDDRISPELTEEVGSKTEIDIQRVTYDTVTETEAVDFETTYEDDSSLAKGQEKTVTEGVKGEKEVTYKVTYVDGEEESREAVSEKVTKDPVNAVIKVGTKEETTAESTAAATTAAATTTAAAAETTGKTIVSKKDYPDCDGSGHGYYEITYSDGTVEYEDY